MRFSPIELALIFDFLDAKVDVTPAQLIVISSLDCRRLDEDVTIRLLNELVIVGAVTRCLMRVPQTLRNCMQGLPQILIRTQSRVTHADLSYDCQLSR